MDTKNEDGNSLFQSNDKSQYKYENHQKQQGKSIIRYMFWCSSIQKRTIKYKIWQEESQFAKETSDKYCRYHCEEQTACMREYSEELRMHTPSVVEYLRQATY